jgi:tetratricopeptide (TPR) repeat protein
MRATVIAKLSLTLMVIFFFPSVSIAQSDAEKFAEGRVAFDKYKDCPAALKALEGVSQQGRSEPLWVYYMAQTHECLGNIEAALDYYQKYNALVPGQIPVIEKMADLRYKLSKAREARVKAEEERRKAEELAASPEETIKRIYRLNEENYVVTDSKFSMYYYHTGTDPLLPKKQDDKVRRLWLRQLLFFGTQPSNDFCSFKLNTVRGVEIPYDGSPDGWNWEYQDEWSFYIHLVKLDPSKVNVWEETREGFPKGWFVTLATVGGGKDITVDFSRGAWDKRKIKPREEKTSVDRVDIYFISRDRALKAAKDFSNIIRLCK